MVDTRRLVVKVGTSSLTDEHGRIDSGSISHVASEIASARSAGTDVVLVSSGAIAAGLPALGWDAANRPRDPRTLQAVSAVGQAHLLNAWNDALGSHGIVAGQVLLAPLDFGHRAQYLQARSTLERLLELGVVPVINENDAIADDEIRFGDNDRIAALVAHLVGADLLVLLTDTPGLMDADPRLRSDAALVEEIAEIDRELERVAPGAGTARGSGGMASKLAAARMASWSGIRCLIAHAGREGVLTGALGSERGLGTWVPAHDRRLPARKLWIAFALPTSGRLVIDDGAVDALVGGGRSLLPAGVTGVQGSFDAADAVEVVDTEGRIVAKGIVSVDHTSATRAAGRQSAEAGIEEMVHRDDMVVLA
ncbi:MAG: glutamate 5-kinase [Microthrixaceae bacterium]|nr:glutamate 5-kinase [Microthrixaceae bacterium]